MFYRVLTGFLSDIILYIAYAYTSQSKAVCIFFSLSLMVPAMGFVILKEKINKGDMVGILLGFGGMLLII
jgi:drug/metabolite transporter (DMT)-like permease